MAYVCTGRKSSKRDARKGLITSSDCIAGRCLVGERNCATEPGLCLRLNEVLPRPIERYPVTT